MLYECEIIKDGWKIHTGLFGEKNLEIIKSVEGQLSDGIWENSSRMEGYWNFECCGLEDNEVIIYISTKACDYSYGRTRTNLFWEMDETKIKRWFGNKIKQIIKEEIKDCWPEHGNKLQWDRDCEEPLFYMHNNITVKDCYAAYDKLLERI